ncbi:Membrane bound O-acyl transferase [Macleaya cordata]|uniref:Membrane bound O-acyl transferase n=1 Tax=Macleaya cordata TaxID=56857 RepID=A0A200QUL8_MACCD|nr:Membrane bound O-acyl transferase [Macleaya cordata]
MELEMDSMASSIGVSVPVLRFLLCFVATIPVSFLHRFVPGTLPKHLYAAFSGVLLSYLSFGMLSNLHFLIPMLMGYTSMILFRRYCGIITFFTGFGYLIGCHVYYMSGDAWKEGGIDATGALMVLTLKVISCAINYNDGLLKEEEGLREAQKKYRLLQLPSLIEYIGYCLCCGSHFAGPVYEMKDYLEWTERKGIWVRSEKGPSPFGATLRAIVQGAFCMALYLYLVPNFPLSRFTDPVYQEWGFWKRLGYQYMSGFTARWKYYFIWSISEASIIISGLGFTGWTDSSPPKPRWDRAKNVDILGVELAKSAVQLPVFWNIQVSTWLRHYVYERLIQKGKKPGFFQLLATQTVSAVWHGLYPGYIIFFVQSALMIAGSRVIYRWQQAVPQGLFRNILVFMNFAYTVLVLNYSCVGFMVLSMHETIASYGSVYYIGTILPIVLILLGIPGLDESYLPRWIGYTFGSLLVLNHFVGSGSLTTPAQLRSEALGLCLAAFSITIPYLGRFLKGAALVERPTLPEGNRQIFVMSEHLLDTHKEDLAWGTYVLLKNTNTISVLISAQGALCVRGYWNSPEDASKAQILDWLERKIQEIGLSDLKETLYFAQGADSAVWEMLPEGTRSLLVQPVSEDPNSSASGTTKKIGGFILLASSMSYAYNDRDQAWIGAVANKFRGKTHV